MTMSRISSVPRPERGLGHVLSGTRARSPVKPTAEVWEPAKPRQESNPPFTGTPAERHPVVRSCTDFLSAILPPAAPGAPAALGASRRKCFLHRASGDPPARPTPAPRTTCAVQ